MKVLFISRGYPSEKYLLNGIFEYDQAKAVAKLGHEVVFAYIDMRSIRRWRKWGIEKFHKDGVTVYGINYPVGRVPKKLLSLIRSYALKKLYKLIEEKNGKPDIMHAHFTGIGYSAAKLKEDNHIPLVLTEHSSMIMRKNISHVLIKEAYQAYSFVDRLVSVSPALNQVIKDEFHIDSTYIPNMVDTDSFKFEKTNKNDSFVFISVGSLIMGKRMDLTIEAFTEAFTDQEDVSLVIIGDGPERPEISNRIVKYNLQDRIRLLGGLERKDISKYMNKSHCFVLPSRSETFGVVYIEAMACGLPVIATRCGGPEEFVNDSNGLLIDVDDKDQLVNAMQYMYTHISSFNAENIVKAVLENYSPEVIAKRIEGVYKEVLKIS